VHLICLPAEAELINKEGAIVRMPVKAAMGSSRSTRRNFRAGCPRAARPGSIPPTTILVALAMQEPQYRSPGVRELLVAVAKARVPCMSIMNMPPLPYLKRIPGIDADALRSCYTDASVWDAFDPKLITLCSPDPQAFRPPEEKVNVLQVRLPTQLQVGALRFGDPYRHPAPTRVGHRSGRLDGIELPVKLKVHDSVFVPLAKWAMLLAGNYRCVQKDGMRPIKDAVHSDLEASRSVYNWVVKLCLSLGAKREGPGAVRKVRQRSALASDPVLQRSRRRISSAPSLDQTAGQAACALAAMVASDGRCARMGCESAAAEDGVRSESAALAYFSKRHQVPLVRAQGQAQLYHPVVYRARGFEVAVHGVLDGAHAVFLDAAIVAGEQHGHFASGTKTESCTLSLTGSSIPSRRAASMSDSSRRRMAYGSPNRSAPT